MNSDNDDDDIRKPPLDDLDESTAHPQSPTNPQSPQPPAEQISPQESEKDRKKRLKLEEKEREKREKSLAKAEKDSKGRTQAGEGGFVKNTFSHISGFFTSPKPSKSRPEVRPKEGVTCRVVLLDGSDYQTVVDTTMHIRDLRPAWLIHRPIRLGDFEINPNGRETDYIEDIIFSPTQTEELLQKIVELHKTHRGQLPVDAELNFLDNAKKLQMYGVHFVPARDSELVLIWLGVYYGGIIIVRDGVVINKFPWPKILKLAYKKKKYYMKIRPAEYEQFEKTIGFQMESHTHAKNFWRLSLEHHTFFRFKQANAAEKNRSFSMLSLTSRHRYSGRTQFQTRSQRIHRSQPDFDRTFSRRTGRSLGGYSMASSTSFDRQGEAWLQGGPSGTGNELLNEIGKVAVLAGTGSNVNKLAYVKTVVPASAESPAGTSSATAAGGGGGRGSHFNEHSFNQGEVDSATGESKKKKKKKARPSVDDEQQQFDEDEPIPPPYPSIPQDDPEVHGSRPTVAPKPKSKKKKNGERENERYEEVVSEQRSEKRGRMHEENGHDDDEEVEDVDHDMALRRAIESVTDVDHRLSVKKIQLDTDQLMKDGKKKKKKDGRDGEEERDEGEREKKKKMPNNHYIITLSSSLR
ncbi:hypothetical protein HELRODRAFT_191970 [Helobdella robusta]|uniref:FERM domain-containing protein n=1 Tax=Helobdella robusta TaxID=6412 RepID=T1FTG8_HELRO|nr:hypothetical protein HELRODRAFT_191970 [Helobdella robusta]ESO03819.1 hypothetical protein HELRODRAFT_191970 [Helobdella robusta]